MTSRSAADVRYELITSCYEKMDRFRAEGLADVESTTDDAAREMLRTRLEAAIRSRQLTLDRIERSNEFTLLVLLERVIDDHRVMPSYVIIAQSVIQSMGIKDLSSITAEHLIRLGSAEFLMAKAARDSMLDDEPISSLLLNSLRAAYMFGSDSNREYLDNNILHAASVLTTRKITGLHDTMSMLDVLEGVAAPLAEGSI
jgi:hypothetical protein